MRTIGHHGPHPALLLPPAEDTLQQLSGVFKTRLSGASNLRTCIIVFRQSKNETTSKLDSCNKNQPPISLGDRQEYANTGRFQDRRDCCLVCAR